MDLNEFNDKCVNKLLDNISLENKTIFLNRRLQHRLIEI